LEKPIPTCGKYAIRWPIRRWKDMEKNKKYDMIYDANVQMRKKV
jgi:hypothetical protein